MLNSKLVLHFCAIAKLTAQIPSGNAIANSQGLLHAETGFSNFEKSLTKQLLEVASNLLRGNDLI